jgi:uncharacterized protein (TIGR04255 family)
MGEKLNNAPVYYTVAQVQFNPILNLDAYVPAIQAKMREARFPDYRADVSPRFVFPFGGMEAGQQGVPAFAPQPRFLFGDTAGQSVFLLETNALSFQTTHYDTFESFSSTVLKGLTVLHEALRLDFVERIGLRYLDAVQPSKSGETLRDFLVPEVLGHALRGEGRLLQSVSETVTETQAGPLVCRVLIRDGIPGLPAELTGLAPSIAPRFTAHSGMHAILDTDASFVHRDAFELHQVKTRLLALHSEIAKAFEATVTDYAKLSWA